MEISRRDTLRGGVTLGGWALSPLALGSAGRAQAQDASSASPGAAPAAPGPAPPAPTAPGGELLRAAVASSQLHHAQLRKTGVIAVVDFSIPSYSPRFFLVDTAGLAVTGAFLVAHGIGSDPGPTPSPCPKVFSNVVNSEASCIGGFVTAHVYEGKHGLSLRIRGLDPTNDNAERRDIVIHSALYVDAQRALAGLPIERSQGCFAVTHADRDTIIAALRDGAFLYAGKSEA